MRELGDEVVRALYRTAEQVTAFPDVAAQPARASMPGTQHEAAETHEEGASERGEVPKRARCWCLSCNERQMRRCAVTGPMRLLQRPSPNGSAHQRLRPARAEREDILNVAAGRSPLHARVGRRASGATG